MGAELAKRAEKTAGGIIAWNTLLTPTVKEALVAEQVLGVVVGQDSEIIRVADVEELLHAARRAAGLL